MSLPRSKLHGVGPQLVCADCSASDPTWASLNRGVLICSECCNVHRSLGRHISQIRSLKKGSWHSAQLSLMYTLANNGANNIWEHLLLDPQGAAKLRRKPTPRDPVYPTKAEFIRAKYANLSFALRPNKDEGPLNLNDLNRQLWSCVRTGHVETTLRLLALGANPNYFDPQKGTSPMHVAAKEGQLLQVELLTIYGGDPAQPDFSGFCPSEAAKAEGHPDLANRLDELQFETTDRLTQYLCGRKPEHPSGQHFVIPEMASGQGVPGSERPQAATAEKLAKRRLQNLHHSTFEKLIQDMYDEVDRRETDASWLASLSPQEASVVNERYIVPFLPVNPEFSATRNQSRQKLAKFNAREFASLIIDVLSEAKRRYLAATGEVPERNGTLTPNAIDALATPDYDCVAPDEPSLVERASVESPTRRMKSPEVTRSSVKSGNSDSDKGGVIDSHRSGDSNNSNELVTLDDYLELKDQLGASEAQVERLIQSNVEIRTDVKKLQTSVENLMKENELLKKGSAYNGMAAVGEIKGTSRNGMSSEKEDEIWIRANTFRGSDSRIPDNAAGRKSSQQKSKIAPVAPAKPVGLKRQESNSAPNSMHFQSPAQLDRSNGVAVDHSKNATDKFPNNLVVKTEHLTAEIQKLFADAQAGRHQSFSIHAAKIQALIDTMFGLVPPRFRNGSPIEKCLNNMVDACISLTVQCSQDSSNREIQEQLSCQVVQAAFEVAKCAKQLMDLIQKD